MFERFSRSARQSVVAAQSEARQLLSPVIDVEHLLLGVLAEAEPELRDLLADAGIDHDAARRALRTAADAPLGPEDAAALRSIGIDLDAVKRSLDATFGAESLDNAFAPTASDEGSSGVLDRLRSSHIPFTRAAKKVMELSLREALARKDRRIEAGHVLLGILRGPNAATTAVLGGPDAVRALREAVHAGLDQAA